MDIEFSLALPRDAVGIPMVRRVLGDTLRCIGVTEDCVSDVLLATSEACANAVRHGGPSKRYAVMAAIGQGRCELRVVDNGLGLGAIPRQYPAGDAEHGRGILIMQSVVDEISFDITPGNGTTVCLRKELDWDEEWLATHDRALASV
ncbi:ATP-binding protein [Sphaerisporangium sp. NPDC004334]